MSIARNTFIQSGFTLISRVLGFVRDILIAARIGSGPIGDAFVTALMFPNSFRRIFAEGAFAQAFIPSYAQEKEANGDMAANRMAQDSMRVLFAALVLLVMVCEVSMPWIMRLIHKGYAPQSEGFKLAVLLTQITMPYLACMGLVALFSGVLNAASRFVFSAAAPTLLNVCMIGFVFAADTPEDTSFWVAIGVSLAGVLQVCLLWWGIKRQGISLRLGWPKWTPKVQEVMVLAIPGVIAASSTQLNIFISQSLASEEMGAKTWLFFADRLSQLPLGLIAIPLGLAILPPLSRAVRRQMDSDEGGTVSVQTQALMDQGLALSLALTIPAALALIFTPIYIVESLFMRDQFTAEDAARTGAALFHYGWGLPAFVLIKVLTPAFFARKDTKTPMYFGLVSIVVNVSLCLYLFEAFRARGELGFTGLAMATSIAAWVNVVLLVIWLSVRGWFTLTLDLFSRLVRVGLASLPFCLVLYWIGVQARANGLVLSGIAILDCVTVLGMAGVVYLAFAFVFGVLRISEIRAAMRP